jgi:hypothetical protein
MARGGGRDMGKAGGGGTKGRRHSDGPPPTKSIGTKGGGKGGRGGRGEAGNGRGAGDEGVAGEVQMLKSVLYLGFYIGLG